MDVKSLALLLTSFQLEFIEEKLSHFTMVSRVKRYQLLSHASTAPTHLASKFARLIASTLELMASCFTIKTSA